MSEMFRQKFSITYDYPVHFTRDVFSTANPLLRDLMTGNKDGRRHRAWVCIDSGVAQHHPKLAARVREYFDANADRLELVDSPHILRGGENAKNGWPNVQDILDIIAGHRLCRQSFVIAVGGGSMLDLVGLAAALVHRGLRLIRVPSTVLAQNDAGVGVKNGINAFGQKNYLGTFAPPAAVVDDFALLHTLPQEAWVGGIAEAFKVAIIKDAKFFEFLTTHATHLQRRDEAAMERLIQRCATLHLEHIAGNGDPFETGSARPLDFGHWSAHKLEQLSAFRVGHGQAVASGIALDSYYALRQGWINQTEFDAICAGLYTAGLPLFYREMAERDADGGLSILAGLEDFREHLGGDLQVTMPVGIGRKQEIQSLDYGLVEEGIRFLQNSEFTESRFLQQLSA